MFHRVLPRAELSTHLLHRPRFEVSVEYFEQVLEELRSDGYRFVSLDHMVSRIQLGQEVDRQVSITFDDGFSDIVQHALPLLERFDAPFVSYVSTGYPDGKLLHISAAIEHFVRQRERIELSLPAGNICLDTATREGKQSAVRQLEHAAFTQFSGLERAAEALGLEQTPFRACNLSWEQLAALARHPLCVLGAHTVTHRDLTQATRGEIRWELEESNRRLAQHTGERPRHFAYPFGRYGELAREEGLRVGYRVMVKTGRACLEPAQLDLAAVPRICALEHVTAP
jgi:peptidoglycan/xylan/chitin deacetylase (PgdA/CDA1 family)